MDAAMAAASSGSAAAAAASAGSTSGSDGASARPAPEKACVAGFAEDDAGAALPADVAQLVLVRARELRCKHQVEAVEKVWLGVHELLRGLCHETAAHGLVEVLQEPAAALGLCLAQT